MALLASQRHRRAADCWRAIAAAWVGVLALFLPWLAFAAAGDAGEVSEARVKAAFLFKFGAYVDWPPEAFARPDSAIVIGIVGADAIAEELARVAEGRTLYNRPIVIKRLGRGDPVAGLHILFLGADGPRIREWLAQAQGKPILTVTENELENEQRSVLKFVVAENKIRFEASLVAAQRNGLRLSSQLLAVAKQVRGSGP